MALAFALAALNLLDLVITRLTISSFGAVEVNPLVAPVITTQWAFALKIGLPIAILIMATQVRRDRVVRALRIAVAIYLVVVIIGLSQIAYALA